MRTYKDNAAYYGHKSLAGASMRERLQEPIGDTDSDENTRGSLLPQISRSTRWGHETPRAAAGLIVTLTVTPSVTGHRGC